MGSIFGRFILLAVSFILLELCVLHAQFKMPYNIGCFGMNGSTGTQFSGPVVIESKSCLMIKNGLFTLKCKIDPLMFSSEIRFVCIPNPVMTTCVIKLQNQISTDMSPVILVVVGSDGRVYENITTTMKQLSSGYFMNLISMSSGVYVIKILLNYQNISTIKIIKS